MPGLDSGKLRTRITFLKKGAGQDATYGTPTGEWVEHAAGIWAEVQDILPSRSERVDDSITIANRPCRIRLRYREDITSAMRVQIGTRTLEIKGGPAELGMRDGIEIIAEELSTQGEAP